MRCSSRSTKISNPASINFFDVVGVSAERRSNSFFSQRSQNAGLVIFCAWWWVWMKRMRGRSKFFAFNAPLQRINLSLQSEVTRPIRSTIGAFPRAAAKVEHRHLACSITPEAGTPSRTSCLGPHISSKFTAQQKREIFKGTDNPIQFIFL